MVPLAVPDIFLVANDFVSYRPLRNKSLHFIRHRRREVIYSHSMLVEWFLLYMVVKIVV